MASAWRWAQIRHTCCVSYWGKGALLAATGISVGLVAALALTQLLKGMLFGVTATDPIAFGAVMLATLGAVMIASYLPARRALSVAPVMAMRAE